MDELYLLIDEFDGEANIFASTDKVETFLKRRYQEGPALYRIMTDAPEPYLRQLDIPEDWKFVDPEEEGETA